MTADRSPRPNLRLRLAIAAVLLTVVLLLGGCGGGDDPSATTVPGGASTSSSAADTETDSQASAGGAGGDEPSEPPIGSGGEDEAGAGGGERDRPAQASLPTSVEGVVEAVLAGPPIASAPWPPEAVCDQLMTPEFVRLAYGAREGCVAAQRPAALARSLELTTTREGDETAAATAIPSGGPYDGVEVEVELVRDGNGWRVDSLLADVPAGP